MRHKPCGARIRNHSARGCEAVYKCSPTNSPISWAGKAQELRRPIRSRRQPPAHPNGPAWRLCRRLGGARSFIPSTGRWGGLMYLSFGWDRINFNAVLWLLFKQLLILSLRNHPVRSGGSRLDSACISDLVNSPTPWKRHTSGDRWKFIA